MRMVLAWGGVPVLLGRFSHFMKFLQHTVYAKA